MADTNTPANAKPPRDELWSVLDWTLWGAGMADTFREPLADKMVAAITDDEHAQALRLIERWQSLRRDSVGLGPRGRQLYEQLREEVRERQHLVEQLAANVHDARIDRDRWRRIALRIALAGDGSYQRLSTEDRDALETGLAEYREGARDRAEASR